MPMSTSDEISFKTANTRRTADAVERHHVIQARIDHVCEGVHPWPLNWKNSICGTKYP